jgi:hypothetical protein
MQSAVLRHLTTVAATGLVLSGCGETSAAGMHVRIDSLPGGIPRTMSSHPIDSGRWRLVHARDVQPAELQPGELLDPLDVAITDDGSVIVADSKPAVIKVFDPAGQLARTIGREGSGPGEFRSAYVAVLGDSLVVQDATNSRATTFDWRTGNLLGERRTACCYYSPIAIDGRGRVAVRSIMPPPDSSWRNTQAFVRFPINGTGADTVFVPVGRTSVESRPWLVREGNQVRMAMTVPYQPRAFHGVDPLGSFVTGWSSEYVLRRTSNGIDTLALFGRDWTAEPVTSDDKQRLVEQRLAEVQAGSGSGVSEEALRTSFDPSYIPDQKPAYETWSVDAAGRTWVRRTADGSDMVRFDLFDLEGRWVDVVSVPQSGWPASAWRPVAWGRDAIAVILEGADGRPLVRVYRIERD